MQLLAVNELIPHPRNKEFFDDVTGDAWEAILESIRTSGVIEPVIITPDKVIVSGHQRVRACKELGKQEVMTETRQYESEDQILKELIETNIRQRGIGNPNPVKLGRCIKELERIYGIQHGGDRKSSSQIDNLIKPTQEDLATEFGISVAGLNRYKKLASAIPELEEFVDTGSISVNTALSLTRLLSADDQLALLSQLDSAKKYTAKEVQLAIDKFKASYNNEDIMKQLSQAKIDAERAEDDFRKMREKAITAQQKVEELEKQLGKNDTTKAAQRDIEYFINATNNYLRSYGGRIWAFNEIENVSENTRNDFIKAIKTLDGFAQQLIRNIGGDIA